MALHVLFTFSPITISESVSHSSVERDGNANLITEQLSLADGIE